MSPVWVHAGITDPEGGLITLVSVNAASTNGAPVLLNGSNVTYTPLSGFTGADRFDYVVSDPLGTQSSVPVQIAILPPGGQANALRSVTVTAGGGISFGFAGLPDRTYEVQRAGSPAGPWEIVGPMTIRSDGSGNFVDPSPLPSSGFYRTRLLPSPCTRTPIVRRSGRLPKA